LSIIRTALSNTIQISKDVRAAVAELQPSLPPGVTIKVSSGESVFITSTVQEVIRSLVVALSAVIGIIFLFFLTGRQPSSWPCRSRSR